MKYQALSRITSVFLCASLFSPSIALAHSGGTDSSGCHRQSNTGTRHCHNSGSDSVSNSTLYIVGGSLLAITIGYFLIKGIGGNNNKEAKINKSNNSRKTTKKKVSPQLIDLQLSSTVSNPNPVNGEFITFDLFLTNEGVIKATDVEISSMLPSQLSFVSASSEQGKYNPATGIWNVGDIMSHTSLKLTITTKVQSGMSVNFQSEIVSANEIDLDSTPNNGNPKEDDQTSILINDRKVDLSKINKDSYLSVNNLKTIKVSQDYNNNISTPQKVAFNQILEEINHNPLFSVKSIEVQKDNYHLELQYKF